MDKNVDKNRNVAFTVVIPTRNRFKNTIQTIASVISQDLERFEVIVSDNSTFEKGMLRDYLKNLNVPKNCTLRFNETDADLSMPENWEQSSVKSSGEYTLIVPDRWVMLPGTLLFLQRIVDQYHPEVVFWEANNFEINLRDKDCQNALSCICTEISSKKILTDILKFEGFKDDSVFTQPFPRGLNSMYRHDIAKVFRKKHGSLFSKHSCDYTSGVGLLLESSRCIRIKKSLYFSIGSMSNGHTNAINGFLKSYVESQDEIPHWRGLKIDAVFLSVLIDIERTIGLEQCWKDEFMHKLHVNNALLSLISEIHYKEFHGSLLDTLGMRQEIFEFIANNSSSGLVCLDVINKFDKLKKPRWIPLRRLCRRLGIFEFVLKINDILRYGSNSGLLCSTRTR